MGFLNSLISAPNKFANNAVSGMFGAGTKNNAADAAMPYLNQVPGIGQQNYAPYNQQGLGAFQQAGGIYGQQAQDPSAFLNDLYSKYSMSGGYQMKMQDALKAAQGASAAGGYAGTPEDIKDQMRMAQNIGDEGFQQYYNNAMGIQNTGLQGLSHQGDVGFNGAGQLSDYLANAYGNQASAAYAGQAQQNQNKSNFMNQIMQLGGTLGGAYLGGPAGAAIGGSLMGGGQQNNPSQSFMSTAFGRR